MKLSDEVDEAPHLASAKRGPLAQVYKNVLLQVQQAKRHRKFGNLWSRVAPSANIYRYMGISQERLRHCLDLDAQLKGLAEEYKEMLGGEKVEVEERCGKLVEALKATRAEGLAFGVEEQQAPEGFLPLQEFLDDDVTCTCGVLIHPASPEERSQWFFNMFLAFVVFIIQTLCPFVMVVQLWDSDDNHIKDLKQLWSLLNVKEFVCLGCSTMEIMTTMCGTLWVLMLYVMIHHHVRDEHDDAKKMGRLPGDNFWLFLGNISQCFCPIMILIAAPLEYWGEDGVTGIMMNSMAMLFVWSLDDLTGDVFGYIGEEDKDFQKQAVWNYALLAYCPVNIRDLVNSKAEKMEDFWKIGYNNRGQLLKFDADKTGGLCETRIMNTKWLQDENSPLVQGDEDSCLEELVVQYKVTPEARPRYLPGNREAFISGLWTFAKLWVGLCVVLPVIWFVCNKPCYKVKALGSTDKMMCPK